MGAPGVKPGLGGRSDRLARQDGSSRNAEQRCARRAARRNQMSRRLGTLDAGASGRAGCRRRQPAVTGRAVPGEGRSGTLNRRASGDHRGWRTAAGGGAGFTGANGVNRAWVGWKRPCRNRDIRDYRQRSGDRYMNLWLAKRRMKRAADRARAVAERSERWSGTVRARAGRAGWRGSSLSLGWRPALRGAQGLKRAKDVPRPTMPSRCDRRFGRACESAAMRSRRTGSMLWEESWVAPVVGCGVEIVVRGRGCHRTSRRLRRSRQLEEVRTRRLMSFARTMCFRRIQRLIVFTLDLRAVWSGPKKPIRGARRAIAIFIDRAGVRLLLLHAQFGQHFDNHARFDFKFPRQLVDSDFLHRWYSF